MIKLKRLNNTDFYLNPELIEQMESTPDTVITLTTGNNFVVKDALGDVIEKIMRYRQEINQQRKERLERIGLDPKEE